jgi:hypothetical protein
VVLYLSNDDEVYMHTLSEFDREAILADHYEQLEKVVEMNKAVKLTS